MTRLSKNQAKIAFSFCTLFALYFPVAFSQQVDTAWVRRYNGPGNGDDKAVALAVDDSGNVYVTGSSFDSTTGFDYCTIKYLPNGDTGWVRRCDGPASQHDYAVSLALGTGGGIYVLGTVTDTISNPAGRFNSALIKYSAEGEILWDRHSNKTVPDSATALTVDKSGNVYVAGTMYFYYDELPPFTSAILEAVKYSSNGDLLWETGWGYCPFSSARAITVDENGNVYVTGAQNVVNLCEYNIYQFDYVTVKFDSAGIPLWGKNYDGGSNDYARAIGLASDGKAYVTGGSGNDYATIKYDSVGNQVWVRRSNALPSESYGAFSVAMDTHGDVYIFGNYRCCIDNYEWVIIKYDSMGNQLWFRNYYGISSPYYRESKAVVLDSSGNVYVTGHDAWYAATLKYDPDGNLIWEKKYGDINQWAEMRAIAVDRKGNVYATGFTDFPQSDFLTIKYSSLPQLKGDLNLDGVLSLHDVVFALNCTFLGEAPPAAPAACDLNCDGQVTPADVVILLLMVFAAAPAPC